MDNIIGFISGWIIGICVVFFVVTSGHASSILPQGATSIDIVDMKAMTNKYKDVFHKVREQSRYKYGDITFIIVESDQINAYALIDMVGNMHVVMYSGFIQFTNGNKDQIAIILGHEIAHHSLLHTEWGIIRIHGERMSDLLGYELATNAGYNKCAGYAVWLRMSWKMFVKVHTSVYESHPKPAERADYFKSLCSGEL